MNEDTIDLIHYHSIVDKYIKLSLFQPNVSYSIKNFSHFMIKLQVPYLTAAKSILRYITKILNYKIFYYTNSPTTLLGYIKIYWTKDLTHGQSIMDFVFKLQTNLITWLLKKQSTTALSSSEAEYIDLLIASKEPTWLNILSYDFVLKISKPMLIFCDNKRSIKMAKNPNINPCTKHMYITSL